MRSHRTGVLPTALALAASFCIAAAPVRATCSCGPDFCQDDRRVAAAFAAKRQSLARQGYPERLLRLFDQSPRCVAAAERAPDRFSLLMVKPNGDAQGIEWTQEDEAIAQKDLAAGRLRSYHVMHVRRTFACCKDQDFAHRPDYDSSIDLNTGAAINCRRSGNSTACDR